MGEAAPAKPCSLIWEFWGTESEHWALVGSHPKGEPSRRVRSLIPSEGGSPVGGRGVTWRGPERRGSWQQREERRGP